MENNYSALDTNLSYMHPLFSSRSVIAGLLVAFFILTGLLGLGFAIGGISMDQNTEFSGIGTFTGIWFGISALVSLFIGSYFAARVSKFQRKRIGGAQGLIIASLFLGFFIYQAGQTVSGIGGLAGNFIGGGASMASKGISSAYQNEHVRSTFSNVIQNTIGDLNIKGEIQTVAINVGNHLLRGDQEGAIDYLSRESGISREEARAKLAQFQIQAEEAIGEAKEATASALKTTGWTIFLLVLLGAMSATIGGALGSRANNRKPLLNN